MHISQIGRWLAFCYVLTSTAQAQPDLILTLHQRVWIACQSISPDHSMAAPRDCIDYELIIQNRGDSPAHQVELRLPVPQSTHLIQPLALQAGASELINLPPLLTANGSVLRASLDQVLPSASNAPLRLQYRVQVH